MAVASCLYISPMQLALSNLTQPATTGVTAIPNWVANTANGAWAFLMLTGADTVTFGQSTTAANYQYVAGSGPASGEVATAHGYTQGGLDMHLTTSGVGSVAPLGAFTVASNAIKYTSAAGIFWTATDATGITATYIGFYCAPASGSKPMMFQLSLGGSFAATGNTATFTVTPAAGGWMTVAGG